MNLVTYITQTFHYNAAVHHNIFIMGLHSKAFYNRSSSLKPSSSSSRYVPLVVILCVAALIFIEVDNLVLQTKTIAGHNLEPTPWHQFPAKNFTEESTYSKASKIIQCSYLSCGGSSDEDIPILKQSQTSHKVENCPEFYKWIHQDLSPWAKSRISLFHMSEAQKFAAFRVVIVGGKLYVDFYFACVQSRAMFTVWGLLQLLRRYPGKVPDVDLLFDCMDKPTIDRQEHHFMPLPLFRYCTTSNHFDIPFPDWSFWGWPEVNIGPWDEEFESIKMGSRGRSWRNKWPIAYWKGNPDVVSPIRSELVKCNHSRLFRAQIMRQDWATEIKEGFQKSKLSQQCDHRYKIYAEGYAWSVSLKYILSCGSLPLIIDPEYEDFFSRGLFPKENYWPISPTNLCRSIKYAVEWGNTNSDEGKNSRLKLQISVNQLLLKLNILSTCLIPLLFYELVDQGAISAIMFQLPDYVINCGINIKTVKVIPRGKELEPNAIHNASRIGRGSQDFMGSIKMDRVYDYMFHLITEYSKLLDYEPVPPASAKHVCIESSLCYADELQRNFLERSASSPSPDHPCTLLPPDTDFIKSWLDRKNKVTTDVENFVQKK